MIQPNQWKRERERIVEWLQVCKLVLAFRSWTLTPDSLCWTFGLMFTGPPSTWPAEAGSPDAGRHANSPSRLTLAERKEWMMKTMVLGHEWRSNCWEPQEQKEHQGLVLTDVNPDSHKTTCAKIQFVNRKTKKRRRENVSRSRRLGLQSPGTSSGHRRLKTCGDARTAAGRQRSSGRQTPP